MEIVHVILGKANPERMNGVNKVVNELASHQHAAGLKVSVWGITGDMQHNYPSRQYATRLFYKEKFPFSLGDDIRAAIAAQPRGTVFHLHGGFVPQMYAVSKLLQAHKQPFVITPHGSYNLLAMHKSRLMKSIYTRLFERKLLQRASVVHVLGASEIKGAETLCDNLSIIRIPYAFDLRPKIMAMNGVKKPFIVGYCGRIDIHTKGLDALLDGFKAFQATHSNSELWLVGDGKDMPALRQMVKVARMEKNVLFCGSRYGLEKDVFLSRFDVFAHPSRNEGLPASVLEAAAMGLPCLVTKATNVGDDIDKYACGVTMETTDAAAVCRGLSFLYEEIKGGKSEALSDNARRMISEAYGCDKVIGEFVMMYQKVLAQ